MSKNWFRLALLLSLVLFACQKEIGSRRMADDRWLWCDSLTWEYERGRETESVDLLLQLEATEDYPFRNLYVRLWTESGNQPPTASLHNFIINDVEGYWYADRNLWTGTYRMELPIARTIKLNRGQKLKLTLVHQLRTDTLQGIRRVGLSWRPSED